MIKAIFIDIDDTIYSFEAFVRQTMREGFPKFGLRAYADSDYDTFKRINDGLWIQIEQGTLTLPELRLTRWNKIFDALGIEADGVKFEEYFCESLNESAIFEPGAHELIEYLRSKYILCAASNGPYDQQLNRLKIGGIDGYFDHIFISSKVGYKKPDREFFEYCFREINSKGAENSRKKGAENFCQKGEGEKVVKEPVPLTTLTPRDAMIIGDSLTSDIAGGRNIGMQTCLYAAKHKDIRDGSIDYVVKDLRELIEIL